jgi:adenylate kinase family enzyme
MPDLIVIYGPPLAGKTTVAGQLGRAMGEKTAVVSVDHLLNEAILSPDTDEAAEIELVHQQVRLMVANYLKFKYHCIVEGPFIYERGGHLHNFETQIDQLLALMRMMTLRKAIVRLAVGEEDMARRAELTGREHELALALAISAAYRDRTGPETLSYDTSAHQPEDVVASILSELPGMPRGQA